MSDREPAPRRRWKPVGRLAEIFHRFETPVEFQKRIVRRTGMLAGTQHLPFSTIEKVIEDSMRDNGGMPNWPLVQRTLGECVRDIYRKFRRL